MGERRAYVGVQSNKKCNLLFFSAARTLISLPDLHSQPGQFHHVCFPAPHSIRLYSSAPPPHPPTPPLLRPCSACAESTSSSLWLIRETHLDRVLAVRPHSSRLRTHLSGLRLAWRQRGGENKTTSANNRAPPPRAG